MEILICCLIVFVVAAILYLIVAVAYVFTYYEIHKKLFFPFNHPGLVWQHENMGIVKSERDFMKDDSIASSFLKRLYKRDYMYCGYVAFRKDVLPEEWHGSYISSGLEMLEIHGGITYADIGVEDKGKEIAAIHETQKLLDILGEAYEDKLTDIDTGNKYFSERQKIIDLHNERLKESGYRYVVFGFDCAHSGDEENEKLGDLNHVVMLTVQMRDQITEFAKVWNLYMATESKKDKCIILDSVRSKAEIRTELGLGGMLNLITGNV